ncbi:MAG: MurR/RpiR family transcriptional regulator [bacterium]
MSRYKEIKKRIQSHYENLPKNQKKLAEYFIDNFDRISFLSVNNISEATGLSVASIVRFAQRIGFTGFLEMRSEIANTLQNHIENKEIFSLLDTDHLEGDTLTTVANQDIKNINDTLNQLDRGNFNQTIKLILESNRTFTLGLGISFLLSRVLAYQLNQVAVDAYNLVHDHSSFMEQILFLNKDDLIIAFSFPPYSKETIEAAKYAKEKNIRVVSITDKNASPITFYSNVHLTVKTQNMLFTNSFSAISVIINAIATGCALNNKAKAKKMLNESNKIAERQGDVIF